MLELGWIAMGVFFVCLVIVWLLAMSDRDK